MNVTKNNQIEATVLLVLSVILKQPLSSFDSKSSMQNVSGWDSLKHIEIIFAIEEELSVQFSETELGELRSVSKIVNAVGDRYET